jgi:CBS-domain-containing membrane protein
MELLMLPFLAYAALVLLAVGIAQGSQTWAIEDDPPYVSVDPRVKPVQEVHRKEPTTLPTKDSAETVDKKPEKAAVPDDLDKIKLVHDVMEKRVCYCREDQSMAEALRIMREHGLQSLPVVDSNLRVVGMVRRHY